MNHIQYAEAAATRAKHNTSHILHLLLSVITGGLWVPVWLLVALSNYMERARCDRIITRLQHER